MAITVKSLDDLQELRKLLGAFDNGTVEFPIRMWYSRPRRRWVVDACRRRWCMDGSDIVNFDERNRKEDE